MSIRKEEDAIILSGDVAKNFIEKAKHPDPEAAKKRNEYINSLNQNKPREIYNVNESGFVSMEEYIRTKDEALQTIIDLGFDYDGYRRANSLKGLIDELVNIARIGLQRP